MSLVIRFTRTGKRGERKYRIIVKEKRSKRDGVALEFLGSYEKRVDGTIIKSVDKKRVEYWKQRGAQISESVKNIL